jgi:hypothetical protein
MSEQCKAIATSKLSWDGMIDNFMTLLAQAHQLRIEHPRNPISPSFGKELVSLALEYKRLEEAVDCLSKSIPTTSLMSRTIVRFMVFLRQTWLGNIIIKNKFLRAISKKILKKTGHSD